MVFDDFSSCVQWIQSSFSWAVDRFMSVTVSGIPLYTILLGLLLMSTILRIFVQPLIGSSSDSVRVQPRGGGSSRRGSSGSRSGAQIGD